MLEIKQLDYDEMKGKSYSTEIHSNMYLSIEPLDDGFEIKWVKCNEEIIMPLQDDMLSDWLDNPVAYGAYDSNKLVGYVEGFLEEWNNRFRITNICVFDKNRRKTGIGQQLINNITSDAIKSGARMIVLETQSFNHNAISFYRKNGFEIIGFDRFAYSNNGPAERNMRIEMGKIL